MVKKKGFTLIELMIVIAILGIIILPLTKIFRLFLDTWWQSRAKLTTQQEAREAAYWIIKEFKGSRRTTLGSILINGGFERGVAGSWDISNSSGAARESSSSVVATSTVRTGDFSLSVTDITATDEIFSEVFTVTFSTVYILSGWFRINGAIVNEFEVESVPALSTGATTTAGTGDARIWENRFSVGLLNAGNHRIRINYTAGPGETIYIDDISLTPQRWNMVNNGVIDVARSTFYYTSQVGVGGALEAPLHSMVVVNRPRKGNVDGVNQLVRKRITPGNDESYTGGVYTAANWRTLGFNRLAENIWDLTFRYGDSVSGKEMPLHIDIVFRATTRPNETRDFPVNTQVYPLTP